MAAVFGIDFGTTNSLAALVPPGRRRVSKFLEADRPHPSVVRYHPGGAVTVGRDAKAQLASTASGVVDDVVSSPKARLGSGHAYYIAGLTKEPSEVAADILRHVRDHADQTLQDPRLRLERAVVTVPVDMDGRARADLRDGATQAGIEVVQFVHEPLAALYGHVRRSSDPSREVSALEGRLVLVFDWGGGTLDITLCRVERGVLAQILNGGDNEVGGDFFDQALMEDVVGRHREQHQLAATDVANKPALREQCEDAKITLSRRQATTLFVADGFDAPGSAGTVEQRVTREQFEAVTRHLVDRAFSALDRVLERAGLSERDISLCLATGGMAAMPAVQRRLVERFDLGRVPDIEHADHVIAEGAAWIAHDEAELQLAKPLELLHADNTFIQILPGGTPMPRHGQEVLQPMTVHCVDPTDGYARLLFARPTRPRRTGAADKRLPYTCLLVGVHAQAQPLAERVEVNVAVDPDCIVRISARSSMARDRREAEVHDLEFGLSLKGLL